MIHKIIREHLNAITFNVKAIPQVISKEFKSNAVLHTHPVLIELNHVNYNTHTSSYVHYIHSLSVEKYLLL